MEVLALALCDILRELYKLLLGGVEVLGVGLKLVGVVCVRIIIEVYVGVANVIVVEICAPCTFPEVVFVVAKEILTLLYILVIDCLNLLIYTIVRWLRVALDMNPKATVGAIWCCPDAEAAEEILAVDLSAVGAVILMPLEVQFTHVVQLVGIILLILAKVDHKVAMVPIGVVCLEHLATITLGSTARCVATEAQTGILEIVLLALGFVVYVAMDICCRIAIAVILLEEVVPLILRNLNVNLGQDIHIEYPVQLARSPRCVGVNIVKGRLLVFLVILAIILIVTALLIAIVGLCGAIVWKDKVVIP